MTPTNAVRVDSSNMDQLRAWDGDEGDYWADHAESEVIASVEGDVGAGWCVVEIGEKLELHDGSGVDAVGLPPPDTFLIRLELCVSQRLLQTRCVDGPARDLEVDLNVDVSGAGVVEGVARTQQLGYQAAEHDELGSGPVVMHDADQGAFGCSSRSPSAWRVIGQA